MTTDTDPQDEVIEICAECHKPLYENDPVVLFVGKITPRGNIKIALCSELCKTLYAAGRAEWLRDQ